jgi:lipopolysaccharide transport system permease protein
VPVFVLSYAGMLAYNVFNNTLTKAGICLVGNAQLVSKVYFPRMVLPLSTAISTLLDFCVGSVVLIALMAFYHIHPGWGLLLMPVLLATILMLALGVGLWASALTVSYRDVQYVLPVLLQFVMYASPVGFTLKWVEDELRAHGYARVQSFYMLNPLASLLEAFRWSWLGAGDLHWGWLAYSVLFSIAALLAGGIAFRRMERKFADVI